VTVKWCRPVCERCHRIEREMARLGNHWYYGADYVERKRSLDTRYLTSYHVAGHVAKHPSLGL
jgi:hypothetical protein